MSFTLANLVRGHAKERPHQVAFTHGDRSMTFGSLNERSSRVASALVAAGVGPGDRVAVLMKNSLEYFEVVFGSSKVDAMVVALNWRLAPRELGAILADAQPTVLVADQEQAARLPAEERPQGMRVVVVGDDYERWLAHSSGADPEAPSAPGSVMLVLYSSGTTGLPKGIMLTNQNLSYLEVMARELFRMRPEGVHLVVSPLFHIGGIGTGLTLTALGGRTVLLSDATPEQILTTIEQERVTNAFFVPAIIQRLVELTEAHGRDLTSLETIAYGAAPMSESLLRRALKALGCGFVGCYGMTETAGTVIALPPDEHVSEGPQARLLRSVGKPLPWQSIRVTDLHTKKESMPGEVGEIWVRSGSTMKGYLNQPAATAQTLVEDGWLRTGDGTYRDEEGYFFLQDRIKDMIISGGENVYPAEVENVLDEHPDVAEVAVIGVPHPTWGETVKALVVLHSGSRAVPEELIEFTRDRMAHYKCPTSVDFVSELPRTATGKVLKKVLRDSYA